MVLGSASHQSHCHESKPAVWACVLSIQVHLPGPMPGGYGVMGDDGAMDYSVHEAWNEATNVYLVVILVSFGLFMYAKRNKRKIMRIFSLPPPAETLSEPNFYDTISKIRLRQQLEMYSICSRKKQTKFSSSKSESESRSVVSDSVISWTIQSMEFSRPEY
ncbi:small integral membrane protein 19 isoform X2 [Ovis aries]|nr:small integral membrane protein 19 isoform X2 [Ovis aries]XP_060263156.1 small integral membrane protein 19 isoform X2 [Ovis aries]XP_060263157.1 small integral membrane protein 19 isoform X2 [Ovis aries]XP_060263158.1 small integral membrane protein 19 isoform X2 [Ovis aries]